MVEFKSKTMKESIWAAGVAALAMHGAMIAAIALGTAGLQGISPHNFSVEVMFVSGSETRTSNSQEESEGYPSEAHKETLPQRIHNTSAAQENNPLAPELRKAAISEKSEVTPVKLKVSKSIQKAVGEKASLSSVSSVGGQPSGEVSDAFPIFNPPPIYPREARRKRIQGVVMIQLSLTEAGAVDKATALPPCMDPLLEDAALKAIHKWRFKPGVRTLEVPIEFKLLSCKIP